jgi:hypothetical protein
VLAAGTATVVDEGDSYEVNQPTIVPLAEAMHHFSPKDLRTFRWFGVDRCLDLCRLEPNPTSAQLTKPA